MAKVNWGKYALINEIEYHFKEEPEWFWKIKPVTSGMEIEYAKFLNTPRKIVDNLGDREEVGLIGIEIAHRQIALTFGGTNIPRHDDPSKPILKDDASIEDIEWILGAMPPDMVMELWEAVGDTYPFWGPAKSVEKDLDPEEVELIREEEASKETPNFEEEQ